MIDPKKLEEWKTLALAARASEDQRMQHDGECDHGMFWTECTDQECAERDWEQRQEFAGAVSALLAEREELLAERDRLAALRRGIASLAQRFGQHHDGKPFADDLLRLLDGDMLAEGSAGASERLAVEREAELLALLRELEWQPVNEYERAWECPMCGGPRPDEPLPSWLAWTTDHIDKSQQGHKPGCSLAAFLAGQP